MLLLGGGDFTHVFKHSYGDDDGDDGDDGGGIEVLMSVSCMQGLHWDLKLDKSTRVTYVLYDTNCGVQALITSALSLVLLLLISAKYSHPKRWMVRVQRLSLKTAHGGTSAMYMRTVRFVSED